jgi:hypothetical protein
MANENVSISKTNEKQGKRLERKRTPGDFITGEGFTRNLPVKDCLNLIVSEDDADIHVACGEVMNFTGITFLRGLDSSPYFWMPVARAHLICACAPIVESATRAARRLADVRLRYPSADSG